MDILFYCLILIVAFLYSSVGHGGASGYLALMALFSIDPSLMKSSALVLNIFVSVIAFFAFYKGGHFKWKILLPFIITSVPMAFIGAGIKIEPSVYKIILGICLLFAIARMFFIPTNEHLQNKKLPFLAGSIIGAILGLVSGMIGIGGGIILSPILILFRWSNMKETAAVSAIFIFLNSASGLFGLSLKGLSFSNEIILMMIIAIIGGIFGSFAGSFKLPQLSLKYFLALVLFIASIKLILV